MAVNVKAFLEKNGDVKGEIRRFQVQPTLFQNDTFQILKNKVAEVFSLAGTDFRMYWQDQDGDFVIFSSTPELQEAISCSSEDGLLRIYVKRTGAQEGSSTDQDSGATASGDSTKDEKEKVFHPGVVCDGCEGSIYGPRYKCIVCPDYDLCSTCEQKGIHPEHDKFKITHPQTGGGAGMFVPPHFRRWMHRLMKRCQTGQNPAGCNASAATGEGSSTDPNGSQQQGETSAEDEYLKKVGENIASFLDPFGIDVTYEVHHGDQHNQGRFRGGGRGRGWRCGRGAWGPWMWGNAGGCGAMPRQARPAPDAACGKPSDPPTDKPSEKPAAEEQRPDAEREDQCPQMEETAAKSASDTPSKEPSPSGSTDEDWTMLTEGEVPTVGAEVPSSGAPGQEGGLYPNLQVTQSVEMMKAMGFNDDGGWLTRLLETTNGDIAQALDTLKLGAEQASRLA
ncbi:hypothetical protein BaRGS_00023181 [Batillaria attramentaria]|uniref:Sequestosome 1 n=1 Tax=Batillaria attramentaria TaxID=370345 RepID=A0ABD0KEM2_9CAEN|nr:hypothetical protein BaRGS_023225 [Batillaria attramentaria]